MENIDDLVRRSSSGDERAFETLMVEYYNFIRRLTGSILYDPAEAEDATQEAFIRAAAHIHRLQPGANLKNWLARIAVNLCRDKLRRRRTRQRLTEMLKALTWQTAQSTPALEDKLILTERQQAIRSAVDALDDKHRLPILLRYVHEMSVAEIAQILNLNEGTVYSRLHYGHLKLRDRLLVFAADNGEKIEETR